MIDVLLDVVIGGIILLSLMLSCKNDVIIDVVADGIIRYNSITVSLSYHCRIKVIDTILSWMFSGNVIDYAGFRNGG